MYRHDIHSWKFPNDLPNLWEGQQAPTFIENFSSFLEETIKTPPSPLPQSTSSLLLPQPAEQSATLHFLATAIKPIKRCSNVLVAHAIACCVGQTSQRNIQWTVCTISHITCISSHDPFNESGITRKVLHPITDPQMQVGEETTTALTIWWRNFSHADSDCNSKQATHISLHKMSIAPITMIGSGISLWSKQISV